MKRGVTWNNSPIVRPFLLALHQTSADWVRQGVETKTGKRVAHPLFFAQYVVVRLVLPLSPATERWLKMSAQKFHRIELVTFSPRAHPNKMQMVRHQAIGRTVKLFARSGVEHDLAES